MLDKAAWANAFGYHLRCKNIDLTHLSFADNLMVLIDGKVRSIEGIVNVFSQFAQRSGISIVKSTMFLARISNRVHQELVSRFPFRALFSHETFNTCRLITLTGTDQEKNRVVDISFPLLRREVESNKFGTMKYY